jgi:catechol 2,3-dioxygenase-like lactoylglutathione lyase family enzyme
VSDDERPVARITGVNHFSVTARDVEASAAWYQQVFDLVRLPTTFDHYGCEDTGYAVILLEPTTGAVIGVHHNAGNDGEPFDERRTGLDHIGYGVESRQALDLWVDKLDRLGIAHSGVRDVTEPTRFSTLVFRDPDNIQLELIHTG